MGSKRKPTKAERIADARLRTTALCFAYAVFEERLLAARNLRRAALAYARAVAGKEKK